MRVDIPNFGKFVTGEVFCRHCPLDEDGADTGKQKTKLCDQWHRDHNYTCPTEDTYAEAVAISEATP